MTYAEQVIALSDALKESRWASTQFRRTGMTPYEYVLRAWELEIVPDLERKHGWTAYTAWQVHQAVKAKQPLPDVYRTEEKTLRNSVIVKRVATDIQTNYLAWLKRLETMK